jgi:hypothetical protein
MSKEEILKSCKKALGFGFPRDILIDGIYILPTRRKHDSGYKVMEIIVHTVDDKFYNIDTICDVVDFESYWNNIKISDLHIDIDPNNNLIHLWSFKQYFKVIHNMSNCSFEVVDRHE